MHKHRIILNNFDLENGKISVFKLQELLDRLTTLAEGAVLKLVEGRSKPRQGQKTKWLRKVLDFQLAGLSSGSTILDIEAPEIGDIYQNVQFGFFDEPEAETLLNESAFGLAGYVYERAIQSPASSAFIDKYILQQITAFDNILDNDQSEIILTSNDGGKTKYVTIQRKTLTEISIIEQKTKESVKTSVIGLLDVLRHKKEQMEIVTDGDKRIRAFPVGNLDIKKLKTFFGEKVKITGLAQLEADSNIKYIEILDIRKVDISERRIDELTIPIFEDLDLKRLAKEQSWQGFDEKKFRKTIQDLNVEESAEELLELLKS